MHLVKVLLVILGIIIVVPIALAIGIQLFCTVAYEWMDLFSGTLPNFLFPETHHECTIDSLIDRVI